MKVNQIAPAIPLTSDDDSKKHLIVLHHGLWGNPSHMEPVIAQFEKTFPDNDFYFLNVDSSSGNKTYDGIDICGERCVDLIIKTVTNKSFDKISFIGYSLGGLIVRYAVGRLFHLGYFKTIRPINFVTIATPHLGTTRPVQFSMARFYNFLQKVVLTRVGPQFTVTDKYLKDTPLLIVMSDPNYDFFKGLKLFKQRVVFANTEHDRSVSYTTASMGRKNPYLKYQHTVIDPRYPAIVSHTKKPRTPERWGWKDVKSTCIKVVLVPILVPIWLVVASTALSLAYVIAKNRQKSIPVETKWLEESASEANTTDPNSVEEDFDELDGEIEEDSENSTLAVSKDEKRIKMLANLNLLKWKKVDVYFDAFNSHGAIMRRKPFYSSEGGDAIHYLADNLFII